MLWDMHLCVFDVRLSFENRVVSLWILWLLCHRKRIIVAVYRSPKPYKILSDCFFNTRKIRNARLILKWTNQSIFCTSSAPMSASSALFCTAAILNVTDIAMHILCASRRTCSTTYSLVVLVVQRDIPKQGKQKPQGKQTLNFDSLQK